MNNWDEIRTAFHVARAGTVSGAADVLGVHHATVIRHIDALEANLGVKLFQRHGRGYTTTEAGKDLLQVASRADEGFTQMAGRLKGCGDQVAGELIVTTLPVMSSTILHIVLEFQKTYPEVTVQLITDTRLFKLEFGEAHVAIRAGRMPDQPDNIVQPLGEQSFGLFAHKDYVAQYGLPEAGGDLSEHRFVAMEATSQAPFAQWFAAHVPASCITFQSTDERVLLDAVLAGAGIGFLKATLGRDHSDMVPLEGINADWAAELWLVTHIDLHRTAKVQAFTQFMKERFKT